MKRTCEWIDDTMEDLENSEEYHHRLNQYSGLKDVRYILYRIIYRWKLKKLNTELFKVMRWDDCDDTGCYESYSQSEALFNFRDLSDSDPYDKDKYVYKIFDKIGKVCDDVIDDSRIVAYLPKGYYKWI